MVVGPPLGVPSAGGFADVVVPSQDNGCEVTWRLVPKAPRASHFGSSFWVQACAFIKLDQGTLSVRPCGVVWFKLGILVCLGHTCLLGICTSVEEH